MTWFQLSSTPATSQRAMKDVLSGLSWAKALLSYYSYLGIANYHFKYIRNYALVVQPSPQLVKESQSGTLELNQCHLDVKVSIPDKLCNAPILPYPNPEYSFILNCNASETAIGDELLQLLIVQIGLLCLVAILLNPVQLRYCTTRKELIAFVPFMWQFQYYLLGRPFVVHTDHHSLTWLMHLKNFEGQLTRLMEELAQLISQSSIELVNHMWMLTLCLVF